MYMPFKSIKGQILNVLLANIPPVSIAIWQRYSFVAGPADHTCVAAIHGRIGHVFIKEPVGKKDHITNLYYNAKEVGQAL